MYVVGLTGGIGSGKSEAAACFATLGVLVIDTDRISHRLTAPGMPVLQKIAQVLGADCLAADGSLDRVVLRRKVFTNLAARERLENILHPLIRAAVIEELGKSDEAAYQIVVVPLLFETGSYRDIVNRTLTVDCSEQEQMRRAAARSGLAKAEVRAIMAAQMPRMERLARADDVLRNNGTLQDLAEAVRTRHEKYLKLFKQA